MQILEKGRRRGEELGGYSVLKQDIYVSMLLSVSMAFVRLYLWHISVCRGCASNALHASIEIVRERATQNLVKGQRLRSDRRPGAYCTRNNARVRGHHT